jgi:protein-S-isoprenylcysteine O-methyltransferase Ste14
MDVGRLVGSGDRIGLVTLPFLVVGIVLNVMTPSVFSVGGPPDGLRIASIAALAIGVVVWLWSAVLILWRVPRSMLITTGPYRVVLHPLYTGVALLVIPWVGFLFDSWLGVVIGLVLYTASRRFARDEETDLARRFGPSWNDYRARVLLPWL